MSLLNYKNFLLNEEENSLFEAAPKVFQRPFFDAFKKLFPSEIAPQGTKSGEAIRARFGLDGDGTAEKNIKKLFDEVGIVIDSIDMHPPGQMRKDTYGSNDYSTYEVRSGNETYWITNSSATTSAGEVQEIGKKQLSPSALGLNGTYTSAGELVSATESAINGLSWMKDSTKEFIIGLAKSTEANTPSNFSDMKEFFSEKNYYGEVSIGESSALLDAKSLQNIVNDFGEVLDGIFILASVKSFQKGLFFPEESNKPLLDIECDGYMISSKDATSGGSPSAMSIIKAMEDPAEYSLDEKETELASILVPTIKMNVWEQYMHVASALQQNGYLNDSAYKVLLDAMGVSSFPTLEAAEKYVTGLTNEEYVSLVNAMQSKAGRSFKEDPLKIREDFSQIGPIFVNVSKEVGDVLNRDYQDAFSTIVTKVLSLKQIYLSIKLREGKLQFLAKASESMKAKFVTSKSAPKTPWNAKISFEFIKK